MKRLLPVVALILLGAGCAKAPVEEKLPMVPDLRVLSPSNGSLVTEDKIEIVGTSNIPSVWIDGVAYPVKEGVFRTELRLLEGTNTFDIETGNGFTTTTLTLLVSRQAAMTPAP